MSSPAASRPALSNVSNATSRRSFTLPARIAPKPAASAPQPSTDGIETLFVCASTKIVSFTASTSSRRTSPSRRNSPRRDNAPPLIPWRSTSDRTLAVGPLRIYRVTSSNVSFLNSGNLLHTIFPRSQCWCVDGESVFVLRIRQDAYYRIELPHQTEADKEKVEDFKKVLGQVLQYEKTRCPFTRGPEMDTPDRPKTPPRKHRPRAPTEKVKKWTFDRTWMPENGWRPGTPNLEGSDAGTASSYEEDDASSVCTDRSESTPDTPDSRVEMTPPMPALKPMPMQRLSVSERAKMFQGSRSVTAPVAKQAHRPSISSKAISEEVEQANKENETASTAKPHMGRKESDTQSIVSTNDSFYSFPSTPSPQYLDAETEPIDPWAAQLRIPDDEGRGRSKHRRHTSDLTVRASSASSAHTEDAPVTPTDNRPVSAGEVATGMSPAPSTPPLVSDDDDNFSLPSLDITTPPDAIRMKRLTGASQKRAFSPMPNPRNLFSPPARASRNQFTSALIRKTAEIVLGPPAHLVSLMLRIAAKISDGVFNFSTYRFRNNAENVPGAWLSEDEEEDDWVAEDDFGIPLRSLSRSPSTHRNGFAAELD